MVGGIVNDAEMVHAAVGILHRDAEILVVGDAVDGVVALHRGRNRLGICGSGIAPFAP